MKKQKQKKEKKSSAKRESDALEKIEDSAHKIWLAGLGAFAKAEQEGEKLFKSLVKEGASVEEQYREHLVGSVKKAASTTASTMDLMEEMFEKRMSEAMARINTPAADSMDAVVKQLGDLRSSILGMMGISSGESAATRKTTKRKAVKKKVANKKVVAKKAVKKQSTRRKATAKKPATKKTTKKASA